MLKFCLILFIVNMFTKAALVYSAMTVGVSARTEQLRKLGNVLFYLDEFKPYLESSYADGM